MEIYKTIIVILLGVLFCLNVSAEDYWGTTLPYYDRGIGGVPSGLGGAFVSLANDGHACFYNPAGIPDIKKRLLNINYQSSFIGGENLIYASYVHNINEQTGLGFSFIWSGLGSLPIYDKDHVNIGTYSVQHYQLGISYGRKLSSRINIGATGKLFYHSIWSYSANSLDLDIGTKINITRGLNYGLVFQNVAPIEYTFKTTSEDLPLTVKTGLNYTISGFLIIYEIDKTVVSPFSATAFVHHIGARYAFSHYLALNAGYDLSKIYLGINLRLERLDFFSGTIRSADAGNLNFGVTYEFSQEASADLEMEDFYQGIVAYQNKDYRTAIKYFKKVKEKRNDPTADYYLRNAEAFLESEEWMSEEEKVLVGMKMELAKRYIDNDEYGKAISTLRDVLTVNPDNDEAEELMAKVKSKVNSKVETIYNEAKILFEQKKHRESLNKCDSGLSLNPEHKPLLELQKENANILGDVLEKEKLVQQKQEEADAFYNLGLESFKDGNWADAINNFEKSYVLIQREETKLYLDKAKKQLVDAKLSEKKHKESEIHVQLGVDLYNKNKIKDAIKEFETAVNLYPQNETAQNYLNEARTKYDSMVQEPLENGKIALRDGRLSDAIKNFQAVLKIDPENEIAKRFLDKSKSLIDDNIKFNLKQGQQELHNRNYSKALEYFREVLNLDPNNKQAKAGVDTSLKNLQGVVKSFVSKGIDLFNKKKYNSAIEQFEKALNLDKEYVPAKEWLEKTKKLYEKNKIILTIEEYMQSGIEQYQNKNYQQAKSFFEKVLQLRSNHKNANSYIKKCDVELSKLEKQERIARVITDGLIQYRRKKYNEAIDIWKKAKEMDPTNKIIDEYISFAEKSKQESMNKYFNDGLRFYEEGNLLKAKENLEKALQQNPKHSKAKAKLSEVKSAIFEQVSVAKNKGRESFNRGDYDEAMEQFRTVLRFEEENDEIVDLLQMAEKSRDMMDEGNKMMKEEKYAEAIDKFDEVLGYNKNDKNAKSKKDLAVLEGKKRASQWYNDGLQYYKNNDLKKAYVRFSSVVEANPQHTEAKNMLDKVSKEIDNKVSSYYKTGLSYYEKGDYKSAITEFNKILNLKGSYKDTSLLLTKANKIYNQKSSQDRKLSQEKVQTFLYEGIRLYRNGKLQEAIDEWEKVLKVYPNHSKAIKYINRAKYKLQQMDKL